MITPGPWRTGPINYADVYSEATGELVALIIKNDDAVDNARFIAAAPDLMRMLKIAREEFEQCRIDTEGTPTRKHFDVLVAKCDSVIAKACGDRPDSIDVQAQGGVAKEKE